LYARFVKTLLIRMFTLRSRTHICVPSGHIRSPPVPLQAGASEVYAARPTLRESSKTAEGARFYKAVRDSFCPPAIPAEIAARWCALVTGYEVSGSTFEVKTDLYEDSEGEVFAEEILRPFMGEENANGRDYGVERIVVSGETGRPLADGAPLR
jgi:hypothetical protein